MRKKILIILLMLYSLYPIKKVYASEDCTNMTTELLEKIESGETKLTYECFGAKGDGVTNDFYTIRNAHDFANQEYINKGINLTVYATSGKTYYLGENNNKNIKVITNTDWQNANFIIDDYVEVNGKNKVTVTKDLFYVTSPMYIKTGTSSISYGKFTTMSCINDIESDETSYTDNCIENTEITSSNVWKSIPTITKKTKNIKEVIEAIKKDNVVMNEEQRKYFLSSRIWAILLYDSNRQFIRSGSNANSGINQREIILVDTTTGEILTDIDWDHNDFVRLIAWPIPNTPITLQNGNFTTKTNNIVYNSSSREEYRQRNIHTYYTGNININNVNHYLDEYAHPFTSEYQTQSNINLYYGFIKMEQSAYINITNTNLTAHTYEIPHSSGTYDLIFDFSSNITLDNVSYACPPNKTDDTCYNDYMINQNVWGISGSNRVKNIVIKNSKLNRIDSHRGITNLYIENTTIGNKGLTLIGKNNVYAKDITIDRSNTVVKLREDYGSTWDGTMLLENVNYIIDDTNTTPYIVSSNNTQKHDYGYTSYFPNIYINGLTIDNRGINNKNITLLKLYESTTGNELYKYHFKNDFLITNVTKKRQDDNLSIFTDTFAAKDTNLSLNTYGDNNKLNIKYNNNDISKAPSSNNVTRLNDPSINTKFNIKNDSTITNTISEVTSTMTTFFQNWNIDMPPINTNHIAIESIDLSSSGINEKISKSKTDYTAYVNANVDSITLDIKGNELVDKVTAPNMPISLNDGANLIHISISDVYGSKKDYTLTITKLKEDIQKGDINRNGKIDFSDVIVVLRKCLEIDNITEDDISIGDINNDNTISFGDVISILRLYLGI